MAEKFETKICSTCRRKYESERDYMRDTSRWRICDQGHLWFNCSCSSTLMIKNGKYDWYSPQATLSKNAASIFNQLPALKNLPHLSTFVMELQTLLQDTRASARQVALVAKKEPLIAARVLQMANSLIRVGVKKIETLEHAISFLGFTSVSDIILAASVSVFKFNTTKFKSETFWNESFLTGMIAESLAATFNKALVPDEVYLAGTLANIGKIVQAVCLPSSADLIAASINNSKHPCSWTEAETANGIHSHSVLGEIGAAFWGLPDYVMEVAVSHHIVEGSSIPSLLPNMKEVVKLANQLSHWVLLEPSRMDRAVFDSSLARFGLTELSAEGLIEKLMPLKAYASAMTAG